MPFLQNFLSKIGQFFSGLFNAAKRTWAKLSPEIQNAMLHASGVVDIINANKDKLPQEVLDIIHAKFPNIDIAKLEIGLKGFAVELKLLEGVNDADLLKTLEALQKYFANKSGKTWEWISSAMATFLAAILAPNNTPYAVIVSLIEFVYQHFIKKQ